MSKLSKFKIGDPVRVTQNMHAAFDKVGVVVAHRRPGTWLVHDQPEVAVKFPKWDGTPLPTQERHLTLADPDVHTVLDQMDAENAPSKSRCRCFEPPSAEVAKSPDPEPDPVNRPAHYTSHPSGIECIEITRHMGFNTGNAFKYIWRADLKGNAIQDLEKAAFYIRDEIAKRKAAQ